MSDDPQKLPIQLLNACGITDTSQVRGLRFEFDVNMNYPVLTVTYMPKTLKKDSVPFTDTYKVERIG